MRAALQNETNNPGSTRTPARPLVNGSGEPQSFDDLMWMAANRFCQQDRHTRLSTDQFREAFYLLIDHTSHDMRKMISGVLAGCDYCPRSVALYLAMEPIEIASPFLASSRTLGQLDLLQIVDKHDVEYARVIATRLDIGPSLVNRLRRTGDSDVLLALESNQALVDGPDLRSFDGLKAKIDENRQKALTEEARQRIPAGIDTKKAAVGTNSAEQALLKAANRGGQLAPAAQAIIKEDDEPLPIPAFGAAFEKAARAHSRQAMAVLMQKRSRLSLETAYRVLEDKTGDTLAVYLKSVDVDEAQANRIQLLVHPNIGLSVHNAMRSVRFYKTLNQISCQEAVAQWPKDENRTTYAPEQVETQQTTRQTNTYVKKVEWASQKGQLTG